MRGQPSFEKEASRICLNQGPRELHYPAGTRCAQPDLILPNGLPCPSSQADGRAGARARASVCGGGGRDPSLACWRPGSSSSSNRERIKVKGNRTHRSRSNRPARQATLSTTTRSWGREDQGSMYAVLSKRAEPFWRRCLMHLVHEAVNQLSAPL